MCIPDYFTLSWTGLSGHQFSYGRVNLSEAAEYYRGLKLHKKCLDITLRGRLNPVLVFECVTII